MEEARRGQMDDAITAVTGQSGQLTALHLATGVNR